MSSTATKREMVLAISKSTGIKKKVVGPIVEEAFEYMRLCLEEGRRIEIRGFGVFDVKVYKAKPARNPRTGDEVFVEAHKKPYFKPGKELRVRVNENEE